MANVEQSQSNRVIVKLELLKVLASFASAAALAAVGYLISASLERVKNNEQSDSLRIAGRAKIYNTIKYDLYDVFDYVTMRPGSENWAPADIVAKKLKLDRLFDINLPLMTRKTYEAYVSFAGLCFSYPKEGGVATKINLPSAPFSASIKKSAAGVDGSTYFADAPNDKCRSQGEQGYFELLDSFAKDIGYFAYDDARNK